HGRLRACARRGVQPRRAPDASRRARRGHGLRRTLLALRPADRLRAPRAARTRVVAAARGRRVRLPRSARGGAARPMSTLLVIDGDSLAHRAYHALPKSIRGAGGRPANALVGFANFLQRLWEAEQPDGVFVGWDTLDVPTYRHEALPEYQSGRE